MPGAVRPVHPALRGLLAGPMVAYDLTLDPRAIHLGVPSASATVIIAFDEPLDVGWLDRPETSERIWASLSGLHVRPALVRTHGLQRGIQLALTPHGCRALFGAPLAALVGATAPLAELPRGLTEAEHARVADTPTWRGRLALLESLLLARLADDAPPRDVAYAWSLLVAGRPVAETAHEVGWSRRHLQTRLRAEVGLAPKVVGRLGRFTRARELVRGGASLAEAAYACGFADQSHLSREWRELAGRPPSEHEEFPILHDPARPAGGGWPHD